MFLSSKSIGFIVGFYLENFHWTYIDPKTGLKAVTRFRHYCKKRCCGSACRHCIYKHENVDEDKKKHIRFNSAFFVKMENYDYTDEDVQTWMKAAEALVKEAGELIKANLGKSANLADKTSEEGHASNVLTETDLAVEKLFRDGISKLFKDHEFIGEENEGTQGKIENFTNQPTWIIDPIDGTMNFVHGNPLVCTSVGLAVNRRIVGELLLMWVVVFLIMQIHSLLIRWYCQLSGH